MPKQFKQWSSKMSMNKGWRMGAIATPVLLSMVWGLWVLPDRKLPPDNGPQSYTERVTLDHPQRANLLSGIGAIAMVSAGVFLFLNFRTSNRNAETVNLSGADLRGAELNGAELSGAELIGANLCDANLRGADLSGSDLNGAALSGAHLSRANLSGANLIGANLNGTDLNRADLKYANLSGADLRYANLSGADLNCALLSDANFSDANLSGALLFFINSREVLNLEPLQLKTKPSPFLCNVALPSYSQPTNVNPNRDCDRIPQLLSARYDISLEEAQGIVDEARQHRWD